MNNVSMSLDELDLSMKLITMIKEELSINLVNFLLGKFCDFLSQLIY